MANILKRRSITGQRRPVYTDDDRLLVRQLYGPEQPRLSIREVARMVGMSKSTVGCIVNPASAERDRLSRRLYYLQHWDEEQASSALYRLEHPEMKRAADRRYRAKHRDEINARQRNSLGQGT